MEPPGLLRLTPICVESASLLQSMADPHDKVPGQAQGRYYVDTQCIDCDLCRETAPANFTRNDEECFSFVFKQPESPDEETLCKDAMDNCPVEAIGQDGQQ
jgi:ferredoxin